MPNVVPIIPLPEHVLLPATPTPYRIFEPSGRALVADLLTLPDDERWLAVPRVAAGGADQGPDRAPFHTVATLARLTMVSPLPDGEYLIVVDGLSPCRLDEVDAGDRPYRMAAVHPLLDEAAERAERCSTASLIQAAIGLLWALGESASDVPLARAPLRDDDGVVYRLTAALVDSPDARQELLETRCAAARRALITDVLAELMGCVSLNPRAWQPPLRA